MAAAYPSCNIANDISLILHIMLELSQKETHGILEDMVLTGGINGVSNYLMHVMWTGVNKDVGISTFRLRITLPPFPERSRPITSQGKCDGKD